MPNHVTNVLTLKGSKDEILGCLQAIMVNHTEEAIKKADIEPYEGIGTIDFNKIIPMPEEVYNGRLGPDERKMYGSNNWYDWSVEHWGTKWNSYNYYNHEIMSVAELEDGNDYVMGFETAWSQPEPVITKLSEMFPELTINHLYFDEFDNFAGVVELKGGITVRTVTPQNPREIFEMVCEEYFHETPEERGYELNIDGSDYVDLSCSYHKCRVKYGDKEINALTVLTTIGSLCKAEVPKSLSYYTIRFDPYHPTTPKGIDTSNINSPTLAMSFMTAKDAIDLELMREINQHPERIDFSLIEDEYMSLRDFEANK